MKRKVLITKKTWSHGYQLPPAIEEVGIGEFHGWGSNYDEFDIGPGNYTVAIIEMSDGTIITPLPNEIKFLTKENNDLI